MAKLTNWEAGQELIKAADCLGEVHLELKKDFPELATVIRNARNKIARTFNKRNSHDFELGLIPCPHPSRER